MDLCYCVQNTHQFILQLMRRRWRCIFYNILNVPRFEAVCFSYRINWTACYFLIWNKYLSPKLFLFKQGNFVIYPLSLQRTVDLINISLQCHLRNNSSQVCTLSCPKSKNQNWPNVDAFFLFSKGVLTGEEWGKK